MEIDPAMPKDAGYYECQADNKYAIDRRGFIAKYELNWKKLMKYQYMPGTGCLTNQAQRNADESIICICHNQLTINFLN